MKILAAKVLKPHGLHGIIKIVSYLNNWDNYINEIKDENGNKISITKSIIFNQKSGYFLVKIDGINTLEDAMKFTGYQWFIDKNCLPSLPEDNFYYHELINLPIVDENNNILGTIEEVDRVGGGDVLSIKLNINKLVYLPLNDWTFPKILKDKLIISNDGLELLYDL